MKKVLPLVLSAVLLGACTTFDPYTGEEKTTNTAIGASIGAGLGAVIAYLDNKDEDSRKRNQRILAGAAGGAAVGGGIGYYWIIRKPSCVSSYGALASVWSVSEIILT